MQKRCHKCHSECLWAKQKHHLHALTDSAIKMVLEVLKGIKFTAQLIQPLLTSLSYAAGQRQYL